MALHLLAFAMAANAHAQPSPEAVWLQVDSTTRGFLTEWRDAWAITQYSRPSVGIDSVQRDVAGHCHWDLREWRDHVSAVRMGAMRRYIIRSPGRAQAWCPQWYPDDTPLPGDERRNADAGVAGRFLPAMYQRRTELRHLLDYAAQHSPDDVRITGQRVRFALDAGAQLDAWYIATSCTQDPVQCMLLRGLVLHRAGYVAEADSIFLSAGAAMSTQQRCAWNDVAVLLEGDVRTSYEAQSCEQRAALEARLWWLADPLYHEHGNERRAEHYARKVHIDLVSQFPDDVRFRYRPPKGGAAVLETLLRYGWPAHVFWGGPDLDRGHDYWLVREGADTAPPYVVPEYTRGRLHTMPSPAVLAAPFTATWDSWQLNEPAGDYQWWPVEHYARDRSRIVQLDEGQSGMLRRQDATRWVWAVRLDAGPLARQDGDTVDAMLFTSRTAGFANHVATFPGEVGRTLIADVPLDAGPILLGVEVAGDSERAAARTRFAADVDMPLFALAAGQQAVSQPLLFEPFTDGRATVRADDAVARMYPATTFQRPDLMGVYWEGYGFSATDTVQVTVEVVREDRPGVIARAAGRVGLARGPDSAVAIRWSEEPGSTRAVQVMEGATPLQMRNVVLDVSSLARGSYRLTLSMNSRNGTPVAGERTFTIR